MGIHYHLHHFMVCTPSIQVYYVWKHIESAFSSKKKSKGCQMLEKPLVMGVAAMHDLFIKYCAINLRFFPLGSDMNLKCLASTYSNWNIITNAYNHLVK